MSFLAVLGFLTLVLGSVFFMVSGIILSSLEHGFSGKSSAPGTVFFILGVLLACVAWHVSPITVGLR